ncbi:MAG: thioredoxin-disulfide reductase [Candidatus Bathyarchaeia archaeon]
MKRTGLKAAWHRMEEGGKPLDIAIIGGGPAGLTAGIYVRRALMEAVLFEGGVLGGQMALSDLIENYPGVDKVAGYELAERMVEQARGFGLNMVLEEVRDVRPSGDAFTLRTAKGEYSAKAVIIATGAEPIRLGVEGEERLIGRGVSYCATCDGPLFKDKVVAVVGGGDSAFKEALYLAKLAKQVYLIHRREGFRAEKIHVERARSNPNIRFFLNSVVEEIHGEDKVEAATVRNVRTGDSHKLELDGIFIYVGRRPNTGFIDIVEKDDSGYIRVNEDMETSMRGVFAAGDCTSPKWRQIATAVGDAAKAAISAIKFVESIHGR